MSFASFPEAVKAAINGKYHSTMRRSIQAVVLFEADRCLKDQYASLKPFQRKWALVATSVELLKTLDFLNDYQRQEIMFRTGTSKEQLPPVLAWRRMKMIVREIAQFILPNAKKLMEEGPERTHDELCAALLELTFTESNEGAKSYPSNWEYKHSSIFTAFRVYYRGTELDPNVFPPVPPELAEAPTKKNTVIIPHTTVKSEKASPKRASSANHAAVVAASTTTTTTTTGGGGGGGGGSDSQDRVLYLTEIKLHAELLSTFQGVVPDEEIAERKRALYDALPPPPKKFKAAGAKK